MGPVAPAGRLGVCQLGVGDCVDDGAYEEPIVLFITEGCQSLLTSPRLILTAHDGYEKCVAFLQLYLA